MISLILRIMQHTCDRSVVCAIILYKHTKGVWIFMKFREPIPFEQILTMILQKEDEGASYCIYSSILDSNELTLKTICYIDDYPEIDDDDEEEIYSDFVNQNDLSLLFREELVQDVIMNAVDQKQSVTNQELLDAICFYNKNDNFMKLL